MPSRRLHRSRQPTVNRALPTAQIAVFSICRGVHYGVPQVRPARGRRWILGLRPCKLAVDTVAIDNT